MGLRFSDGFLLISKMNILGLNAYHGDSAAALFVDGRLAFAIEEERLNRIKHWAGFPALSIQACLKHADPRDLRHVAISRNPRANLWPKLETAALSPRTWPRLISRARNTVKITRLADALEPFNSLHAEKVRLHQVEHHRTHLASAFFPSPFDESAVLSIDGFGDFTSLMWAVGSGNHLEIRGSVTYPHSLGLFYSAFTQLLGFRKYGDEYKMMGLAAYGEPRFLSQLRDVVRVDADQVRLNLDYFTHHSRGVEMTWNGGEPVIGTLFSRKMIDTFGPPRGRGTEIQPCHADLAASVQARLEECYFALLNHIHWQTGLRKICLAGGVALNCVANGKILEQTGFQDLYIQPAAHDAGTSIGAALYVWHQILDQPRFFQMQHCYFGPEYDDGCIRAELQSAGAAYNKLSEDHLIEATAQALARGKIVGWFQGRMEFGPRALGNRSILADPRRSGMKDVLNRRIKLRETFRPFCPSVLAEAAADFFTASYPSPFMVQAYRVKPAHAYEIPAVTHADGTARVQTVERQSNPLFWKLLARFGELTGVPVLLNTSFNENEPIVNTPREALDCFLRTGVDLLVMGHYLVSKCRQPDIASAALETCVFEIR
jgi:carbamoyltransferase